MIVEEQCWKVTHVKYRKLRIKNASIKNAFVIKTSQHIPFRLLLLFGIIKPPPF